MEKLSIDFGVKEYEINENGILRFNPSDPNVSNRFSALIDWVQKSEKAMQKEIEKIETGEKALAVLAKYDKQLKEKLAYVFGAENDFDVLMGGVNLMAVGKNGKRVVMNLLDALMPIIQDGVKELAKAEAADAVKEAKARRENLNELDTSEKA